MSNIVTRQSTNANLLEYASENRGLYDDLTIITATEKKIYVNRLILAFHSKYFEGIFKSILRYDRTMKFRTVDEQTLETLIDFMYGGFISISDQNVMDLLEGADYLKIEEVKQFCFEFLQLNITPDNLLLVFKIAFRHKNDSLMDNVRKYVRTNLDDVVNTDEFKALSKNELVSLIFGSNNLRPREVSIYRAVITWTCHNEEARANEFPELFHMINLNKIDIRHLETVVLKDSLVLCNHTCKKQAISVLCNLEKELLESNESHIISVGGTNTRQKVTVVLALSKKTTQSYANLVQGLDSHCSLKLNDCIYSIGGRILNGDEFKATDKVLSLNMTEQSEVWTEVALMKRKRYATAASVYRGTLFVTGGADKKKDTISSSEYFVPRLRKWKTGPRLKQSRKGHALVACGGYLFTLGGWCNGKNLSSVERLGNLNEVWQNIQPMQTQRAWLAAVNCNGVVYAIGGRFGKKNSTCLNTVEKYDPSLNQWKYVSGMNRKRRSHAACVLRGKIYVVGGSDSDGNVVRDIECYDPEYDTWSVLGNISDSLLHCGLVVA